MPFTPNPVWNKQDQAAFNAAYLASLRPELLTLTQNYEHKYFVGSPEYDPKAAATLLADAMATGHTIDTQIMLWGMDPYTVMFMRVLYGYTYVPSFGQPNFTSSPGNASPFQESNIQAGVPAGTIAVSLNPADYPPYVAPIVPPPIPLSTNPVGSLQLDFGAPQGIGNWYAVQHGDTLPLNTFYPAQGVVPCWEKQAKGSPFVIGGQVPVFWVKIS